MKRNIDVVNVEARKMVKCPNCRNELIDLKGKHKMAVQISNSPQPISEKLDGTSTKDDIGSNNSAPVDSHIHSPDVKPTSSDRQMEENTTDDCQSHTNQCANTPALDVLSLVKSIGKGCGYYENTLKCGHKASPRSTTYLCPKCRKQLLGIGQVCQIIYDRLELYMHDENEIYDEEKVNLWNEAVDTLKYLKDECGIEVRND
jgi:Zn finger protein HypA/HybF involved in hydrogenase expression